MEKYGFIYLWRDRKHNRYYIGCHWGTVEDGYICSSAWMNQGYKHRPKDFKRRILQTNIPRANLLEEEFKWLSLIKDAELKTKYYNLSKRHFGHWTNHPNQLSTIEKIRVSRANQVFPPESQLKRTESLRTFYQSPQGKEVTRQRVENRAGYEHSEETKRKIGNAHRGKIVGPLSESTKDKLRVISIENNAMHRLDVKEKHRLAVQSEENRNKISNTLKGKTPKNLEYLHKTFWWTNGAMNKRSIESPGPEWYRGKLHRTKGII